MGRKVCCSDHKGNRRGPWTAEEDQKLINYIQRHGPSNWRTLPKLAGLSRCGKSCRMRWANYLRPDIKFGAFSMHEDLIIIRLHAMLGNKWSAIASYLPGRTDNQIKNRWNTKLEKQLLLMGIDPVTRRSLPTPDDMHSFIPSSSTVESSIAVRCNTALVESEEGRIAGGYVNNMCNRQPSQSRNLLSPINNTVKPPVWAQVPGARPFCENSLPSISMDRLPRPSTSGWLYGFRNEINHNFNSTLNNPIEYNTNLRESLQFSNLERKSEGAADTKSSSGIPNEDTMYDESRPSYKGGTSEILEDAIQYYRDDPSGSSISTAAIPTARADPLNKGYENNYWYNLLNLIESNTPESNLII